MRSLRSLHGGGKQQILPSDDERGQNALSVRLLDSLRWFFAVDHLA